MENNLSVLMGARKINISNLQKTTNISKTTLNTLFYERNCNPNINTIKKLCDYFDVTFDEFFGIREISFK